MPKRKTGHFVESTVAGEQARAFIPSPLPPHDPPLQVTPRVSDLLMEARHALSQLELASEMVPSLDWFIYGFVRKEAVVSSQIEGTQATLVDLLALEAETGTAAVGADLQEVCNYLEALNYARGQLASPKGPPLSMRLLNEAHRRLLQGERGDTKRPGEIRQSQNWIGGSRPSQAAFVPPPPGALPNLLTQLERFIHEERDLPPLIRAGLIHVQFETIHPYLDGNGRIGRLLVTLLLEHWGLLPQPLLYLSLYFKRGRSEYYRRLSAVRTDGDWEGWIEYFLTGVKQIADEAVASARDLASIVADDRRRVLEHPHISVSAIQLLDRLPRHPIISSPAVVETLGVSKPTAARTIALLEELEVLKEITGRKRDRAWAYHRYLERLRVGTDL